MEASSCTNRFCGGCESHRAMCGRFELTHKAILDFDEYKTIQNRSFQWLGGRKRWSKELAGMPLP